MSKEQYGPGDWTVGNSCRGWKRDVRTCSPSWRGSNDNTPATAVIANNIRGVLSLARGYRWDEFIHIFVRAPTQIENRRCDPEHHLKHVERVSIVSCIVRIRYRYGDYHLKKTKARSSHPKMRTFHYFHTSRSNDGKEPELYGVSSRSIYTNAGLARKCQRKLQDEDNDKSASRATI